MRLTIHDCNKSIRLHNDLEIKEEVEEAIMKLLTLEKGIADFRAFITQTYLNK